MNHYNTNLNSFTKSLLASLLFMSVLASSASADDKDAKKTDISVSAKRETTKSGDGKSTTTSGSASIEHKVSDNAKVHGKATHSETNHANGSTETNSSVEVGGSISF